MPTIVIGYDETEPAKRALDRAVQLAQAFGSKLVVTSVAPVEYYAPRSAGPVKPGEGVPEHRDQLATARAHIGERVEAEYIPAAGEPADTIVEIANERGADLIVVGTRDLGIIQRLLGQSVSESVARQADCDVLIVQ